MKIQRRVRNKLWREYQRLRVRLLPDDDFLKKVRGVIHIGANSGQERDHYAALNLNVVWAEPIPAVFEELQRNIAAFPGQRAYQALLAEEHGVEYTFHISSNAGASSSIFSLAGHTDVWPEIHYTHDLRIAATTLTRLVSEEHIDLTEFGALVLDTQGSELLVLKGALPVLDRFQYVKSEVADFEVYAGCCQLEELVDFMRRQSFVVHRKTPFARRDGGGRCYDVVFKRS